MNRVCQPLPYSLKVNEINRVGQVNAAKPPSSITCIVIRIEQNDVNGIYFSHYS